MFVISLSCEISEAADPGFYVGAAGGRSEQSLDKRAGVGPAPAVAALPRLDAIVAVPGPPSAVFSPYPPAALTLFLPAGLTADETDVGWNFSLGYRVNKYLAAELAYVDSGEASLVEHYRPVPSTSPVSSPVAEITRGYSVTSRGPALSLLGSLPLSSQWEVFLRGGVLFAKQEVATRMHAEGSTVPPGSRLNRDFSDEVFTVGAGVQWAFLPRWTARLEYQRTDTLQANEIMGESRIDQTSLSVLFGL